MAKKSSMSPQDYAQSYMKGLGITPIDDLNTDLTFKDAAIGIGSVLPGIGTAMTVSEIEEELKKENPSYATIVLLGGSELVGLIPGLGTAAKVGLRTAAKKVGANKVVDVLDSVPDSKDVAKQQMLIGPGGTGYDNRSLGKAQELKAKGYSPKEIEEITGRVQVGSSKDYIPNELVENPQVPFKFEIPDKGIIIKNNDGYITLREASKQRPIRVGNLIPTHTKLFEQYPDLKNVAFYIDPKLSSGAHFDRTDGSYGSIVISEKYINRLLADGNVNNPEFRDTFFHELQHAAQARDYHYAALRQLGGGPKTYSKAASGRDINRGYADPTGKNFREATIAKNPKLVKIRDKMIKLFKEDTRGLDSTSKVGFKNEATKVYSNPKTAKKMAELMKELDHESYKTYLQTASEVEAAVVGARAVPTFKKDQPSISSEVSKRKNVENYKEFARGYSDSKIKKLLKRMATRKADLTEKEISDLAGKGINFVRYALEIDDKLFEGFSEGGLVDTGKKTPEGRIIWNDGGKDYSERTTTFEIDGKWYTMPTVAEDGLQYTSDQMRDYVAKYGPIDFITGEKLPEFKSREDAEEYAVSRSDTRKSFDKGGLATQMDSLFGWTAEGAKQEADEYLKSTYRSPKPRIRPDFRIDDFGPSSKYSVVERGFRKLEAMGMHPLDSIPFFDRPMSASTKDRLVGVDVVGNPVFRTILDEDYVIRMNPDQRTWKRKFHDDILPVIEDYVKDPKLPTKEQVAGFGKAVYEGIKETASIPGDVLTGKKSAGEVTMGDIADLSGMLTLGASAFNVPKDSLRMASVSGMFARKKTPVEEYLTPVEADYGKEVVELIGSISKDLKGPGGLIRGQEIKPLKFDETTDKGSVLVDNKTYNSNRFKISVGTNIYTLLGDVLQKGLNIEDALLPPTVSRAESFLPETKGNFVKQTADMATTQIQKQFNTFLSDNPASILKLGAAKKLKEKYKQYTKDEDGMNLPTFADEAKYDAAVELEEGAIREIIDKFFLESGIAYTPDPGQFFKEKKFTFEVTRVDRTGAQVVEKITEPDHTGLFKDLGWDHGVYDYETVFGRDSLKKHFALPLRRVLKEEFGSTAGIIDSDTRIVKPSPGDYKKLPGNYDWPELSFQDIVDSYDKNLLRSELTSSGDFINLGEEILNDFVGKKLYTDGKLNKEKLTETVLGADLLKLLENDPRMNVKNIPEFMKTQEFKNRKITLQDVGEDIIDNFTDQSFNVKAKPLDKPQWATMQLQRDAGFEGGVENYTYEVPVLGRSDSKSFTPKRDHYGSDTLSHVRFTVYNPTTGVGRYSETDTFFDKLIKNKDFILVEELQSDLLSKKWKKFEKIPYKVENTRKIIDDDIKADVAATGYEILDEAGVQLVKEYADDLAKDITEFFDGLDNKLSVDRPYSEGPDYQLAVLDFTDDLADDAYHKLKNKYTKLIQKQILDRKIDPQQEIYANNLLETILSKVQNPNEFTRASARFHGGYNALSDQRAVNIMARANPNQFASPPIKNRIEGVELNIQTLINQANNMGIDRIVIPNFDMIAARRFGGDELEAAINNKSIKKDAHRSPMYDENDKPVLTEGNALYKNYVTDLEKALDKFKKEYPEIKIEYGVELPYRPMLKLSQYDGLRTEGIVIDISELKKIYDLEKPKFSGGGLVREQ